MAISAHDKAIVDAFAADLARDLTPKQRRWLEGRRMVEASQFTEAELDVLCTCHRPDCVVHGEMPIRVKAVPR